MHNIAASFFNKIMQFFLFILKGLNSEADAQANLAVHLGGEACMIYLNFLQLDRFSNFIDSYSVVCCCRW